MQDENNVNLDTPNETGTDTEIILDDGTSSHDIEALKEQNKRLFERDKKAEGFERNSNGQWVKKAKPTEVPINNNQSSNTYGIEDEVLDLRLEGYSKSDVEFIMKNGGKKALEDKTSLTSIAISQKRQQEKAETAAGQVVDSSSMSDFERKYSPDQMRNMSTKELEAILPKAPNQ